MGHDNMDRQVKQKLERRRIMPSSEAWEKLDKKLEETSHARTRKSAVPYWMAASVIVLLTVGIWLFKGEEKEDIPQVTDIRSETKSRERAVTVVKEDTIISAKVEIPVTRPEKNTIPLVKSPETDKTVPFPEKIAGEKSGVSPKEEEAIAFEDKKVEEVVSRIMEIQEKREVTDEEIDFLLAEARKEIDSQRILIKETGTVDATALLEEAESELDKSFRDKVFEALREGIEKVRTAVANRNP